VATAVVVSLSWGMNCVSFSLLSEGTETESGRVSSWVVVDRVTGRVRRMTLSLNSTEGLRSGFCTGVAEAVGVG